MIVMLTAEEEGGQLKCHRYWAGHEFGPLRLKAISEHRVSLDKETMASSEDGAAHRRDGERPPVSRSSSGVDRPHVIVRKFSLSHTFYPFVPMREITQFQYVAWPDFGAPTHPKHVLALIEHCDKVVRSSLSPALRQYGQPFSAIRRPVLVHCSAGCGRTGTFCTIDSVLDMLKRQRAEQTGSEPIPPLQLEPGEVSTSGLEDRDAQASWLRKDDQDLIAKTVEQLRGQRISMVQSLRQFVLCYEAVLEWCVAQRLSASRNPTERNE